MKSCGKGIKNRSIKARLVNLMAVAIVIICAVNSVINGIIIRGIQVQGKEKNLLNTVNHIASSVDQVLKDRILMLQGVARKSEILQYAYDSDEMRQILLEESKDLGFTNIYMANLEGSLRLDNSYTDTSEFITYIEALQGKSTYSSPTESSTGTVINLGTPVYNETGEMIGVLIATQSLSTFSEFVTDESHTSFIMDANKSYIAHSKQEILESGVVDITAYEENEIIKEEILANEKGNANWRLETDGEMYFMAYDKVPTTGWTIALLESQQGVSVNTRISIAVNTLFNGGFLVIVIIILLAYISAKLTRHIEEITKYLGRLAKGNFKIEVDQKLLSQPGEIGMAAKAMNEMRKSVGKMIDTLQESIESMKSEGEQLMNIASNTSHASTEISNAANEIAISVQQEATDLAEVLESVNTFGKKIEDIVQGVNMINDRIVGSSKEVEKGNENAHQLEQSVEEVNQSTERFINTLQSLTKNISRVTDITALIDGIANQTNLLALNASIEAARAGEAGKGFAVVAEEIRKLADECKKSADSISYIVGEVVVEAESVVGDGAYLDKEMQGQKEIINNTLETYTQITKDIEQVAEHMAVIAQLTQEIEQDKNNIIDKVENSAALGEEISATTQEVAASTRDMLDSAERVKETSSVLGKMTENIAEEISIFKV